MKMDEAIKMYLENCKNQKLVEKSIETYSYDLKCLQDFSEEYGNMPVEELNRKFIRSYVDYLQSKYAARTSRHRISTFRSLMDYLYEFEEITNSPFWGMNIRIKNNRPMPSVMEMGEINRILYAVHSCETYRRQEIHLRDVAILELLFYTGIRNNELVNLKYCNWDTIDRSFHFTAKGNKERTIFIDNKEVSQALLSYMAAVKMYDSEYIFLNRFGSPLSTNAVLDLVGKYALMAGIDKRITPHSFRRTFGTLLIEGGMDISYVQKALGHSSITTTQYYIRLSNDSTRRAIRGANPRDLLSFKN